MDEDVAQFLSITGTDNELVARGYLEISGNDPMQAIQLFFESPELAANFTSAANTAGPSQSESQSSVPITSTRTARRGATGREDDAIIIDSDDDGNGDGDVEMGQPGHHDDDDDGVAAVVRAAQEEDDAAMARRLQEEMYTQGPSGDDDIRAPMGRTTETLVAPDPSWGGYDDDREAAVLEQLRRRRQPAGQPGNPFSQSVWDDTGAPGDGGPPAPMGSRSGGPATGRSQRLADMFRPPYDLMSHLSWDDARQDGKDEKKWIMVNVQDMSDFACQTLNRDHWKDENIKALLKEHFIFLQYEKNDPAGQEYIGFYFGQGYENPANYPYVAIIDPRTGEQVKLWSGTPFPQKSEFYSDMVEFLDRYSLAANSKNPVPKMKPKNKPVDVGRMTEDEMLEMALKNSLETNGGSSKPSEQDPDELTQSTPDLGKGKGKATEDTPVATSETESPFSQISSGSPHVEPEHNPASTTRIQFKHPAGRVIRRFATSDPVRRIYEWLKAEPLEGKEGVTFELKAQPGGDLIDKLDMTIEQASLKQGTVMIEFVEDE